MESKIHVQVPEKYEKYFKNCIELSQKAIPYEHYLIVWID
jgi:hypothetical protein